MPPSEIEKLERRYSDNPQGLTFAPLAEAHRKTGGVPRALELLRLGLALHPDYIPASIVLGRCHLDLGDLPAAEAAFSHVLELDAENVIALKALADITERQGRFDEAERWLHSLLLIDRSNDEARDQLGRVEAARRHTESAALAAPAVDHESESVQPAPSTAGLVTAETPLADQPIPLAPDPEAALSGDQLPMAGPPETPQPPRDAMAGWASRSSDQAVEEPAPLSLRDEPFLTDQPAALEGDVEPLAGLVGRDARPDDAASHDGAGDFRVEMAEDIVLNSSGGSEFQMANASEELLAPRPPRDVEPLLPEPPPIEDAKVEEHAKPEQYANAESPAEEQPTYEAASPPPAQAEPWTEPVAEPPRQSPSDQVLTESMAELLLRQGHHDAALAVYRHLETRHEGEPRFLERIAELERAVAAHPPTRPSGAEEEREEASLPSPAPAYTIQVTHGRSVQTLLRDVLAARPPASAARSAVQSPPARAGSPAPEGAPTRPAHDSLSLSSVFGEEASPMLPAVPAGGDATAQSGVSYDEFFSGSAASAAPRPQRTTDAKSDDLDQFHAWLQNLKR